MADEILHSTSYTCSWCGATDSCLYMGTGRTGRVCNRCGQSFLVGVTEAKLAAAVERLEEIRAEAAAGVMGRAGRKNQLRKIVDMAAVAIVEARK